MKRGLVILIVCLLAAAPRDLSGQAPSLDSRRSFVQRALMGGVGMAAGTFAGAATARAFGPYDCDCQYPGLVPTLGAVAVGSIMGTAFGASWSTGTARCTRSQRFRTAAFGAAAAAFIASPWFFATKDRTLTAISVAMPLNASRSLRHC